MLTCISKFLEDISLWFDRQIQKSYKFSHKKIIAFIRYFKLKDFLYYILVPVLLTVNCDVTEPNPQKGLEKVTTYKDGNAYYALCKNNDLLITLAGHPTDDPHSLSLLPHLDIFNISQPGKPVRLSSTKLDSITYGFTPDRGYVAYMHPYLYLECYPRVRIFDLSDPSKPLESEPIVVPSEYRNDSFEQMKANGNYLYICSHIRLLIFNISNGNQPQFVTTFEGLAAQDIEFHENYAFASCNGLKIFDMTNPINPSLAGQLGGRLFCGDITIYQEYAFLYYTVEYASQDYYDVIDIKDKRNPKITSLKLPTPRWTTSDLFIGDDFLYTGGHNTTFGGEHYDDGVYVIHLKEMRAKEWHGFWAVPNTGRGVYPDQAVDFDIEGRTIYVAHQYSGFSVLINTL